MSSFVDDYPALVWVVYVDLREPKPPKTNADSDSDL